MASELEQLLSACFEKTNSVSLTIFNNGQWGFTYLDEDEFPITSFTGDDIESLENFMRNKHENH